MAQLPRLRRIVDPIADDCWSYAAADGSRVTSRVCVGRPQPWPRNRHGDWICSVSIEHFTDRVVTAAGVGPVDALMNAMALVKAFVDQVGPFSPGASEIREGHESGSRSGKRSPSQKKRATRRRPRKQIRYRVSRGK
jgi:hypothetical protein